MAEPGARGARPRPGRTCCRPSARRSWSRRCRPSSACDAGDVVVIPELAYPTYEIGAIMAGATVVRADSLTALGPGAGRAALDQLAVQPDRSGAAGRAPGQDRRLGHGRAAPSSPPTSATSTSAGNPRRCRSCIRTSAAATTPACWPCTRCPSDRTWPATGPGSCPATPQLVASLIAVRRHLGAMVPDPGAGGRAGRAGRRRARAGAAEPVRPPPRGAPGRAGRAPGSRSSSEAGLYLWCTRGEPAMRTVDWFAERGILVGAGHASTAPAGANQCGWR